MFQAYLSLTKPRISFLFAFTGLAAAFVEGALLQDILRLTLLTLAIFIVGGAANAFNQYFEREVDAQMARTAKKRSLPTGKIKPRDALTFSLVMAVVGNFMLWSWGGWLALFWGVMTILYYSFFYTLWLKPRTPYNIVIGGAAGATGPLIAWAAATGTIAWAPVIMFLIIFFWTPPHFWALALCCKADYARVSYPMLPNVAGDDVTRRQIVIYSVLLVPITLLLNLVSSLGALYFYGALLLGIIFLVGAWMLFVKKTGPLAWKFFGYSIVYLFALFALMMGDAVMGRS